MKYEIEVISPVHIGSGGTISPIEYVVEDNFYRVDMDKIFGDEQFETDRFIEDAKKGTFYLGKFAPELAKEHVRYTLDISHPTRTNLQGLIGSKSSEVREFIKTKDDAYIPGTSIKGAIRTAILWWVLKNDRMLFEKVKRYLEILLNARNLSEQIENARNIEEIKREIERNYNLKQNSDAYMDLLVMIAGGEVRKIKKKVRDLRKIGREHVDDEIEEIVFGQDPTKDLLKAL
jgi:CRISPR type III-A-associated RAMP protein Csm5